MSKIIDLRYENAQRVKRDPDNVAKYIAGQKSVEAHYIPMIKSAIAVNGLKKALLKAFTK